MAIWHQWQQTKSEGSLSDRGYILILLVTVVFSWLIFMEPQETISSTKRVHKELRRVSMEVPLGHFRQFGYAEGDDDFVQLVQFDAVAQIDGDVNDLIDFEQNLSGQKHRISQIMSRVIRSSTPKELDEPGLETVREKMRTQINGIQDRELVDDVMLINFQDIKLPNIVQ